MCTVVAVMLKYVYCCGLSRLTCVVAQEGVRSLDAYDQQQMYSSENSLIENTFMSCG